MSWILGVIFVAAVVVIAVPLSSCIKMAATRLRHSNLSQISEDEIPAEMRESFESASRLLLELGYKHRGFASQPSEVIGIEQDEYLSLYFNEDLAAWAEVWIKPVAHPALQWRVVLVTPLASGGVVASGNLSEEPEGDGPWGEQFAATETLSLAEHLVFHEKRIAGLEIAPSARWQSVDDFLAARNQAWAGQLSRLVEEGKVTLKGDYLQVPLVHTFPYFKKAWSLHGRCARLSADAKALGVSESFGGSETSHTPNIAQLIAGYRAYVDVDEKRSKSWFKSTAILVGSVVVFAALWGVNWGWESLLAILIVLFVHESGHLLGMWLFGYKNLQMLFIPFLGAAVIGRKDSAPAWQEAIVLMLGPLPGLVAGLVIMANAEAWEIGVLMEQIAIFAIILNAFNLLPVLPFDGGRLVDLALFNRFPLFKIGFDVLSVIALGAIALALDAPVLLALAGLLAFTLVGSARENLLMRQLVKARQQFEPKEVMLESVAESVAGSKFAKARVADRYERMRSLMSRLEKARAGALTSIAVLAIWFGSLMLPVGVSLKLFLDESGLGLGELIALSAIGYPITPDEWQERVDAAESIELKISEAVSAAHMMFTVGSREDGLHFSRLAVDWAESPGLTVSQRANAYQSLLSLPQAFDLRSEQELHDLVVENRRYDRGEDAPRKLAEALYSRGLYFLEANPEAAERDWLEAREIALNDPSCTYCEHILHTEAIYAEATGDFDVAEQLYATRLAAAADHERVFQEAELLAFYIRTDQVAERPVLFDLSFLTSTELDEYDLGITATMGQALALGVAASDPERARAVLEETWSRQPADLRDEYQEAQHLVVLLAICRRSQDSACVEQAMNQLNRQALAEGAQLLLEGFVLDNTASYGSSRFKYTSAILYPWVLNEAISALQARGPLEISGPNSAFPDHWLAERLGQMEP